jgi:hypothetical protein
MTPVFLGQLLGVSFACGLNLYATVAAMGLFSRVGLIQDLPPALRGLESGIVIGTALVLYVVEAIFDRVSHVDSVWDTVHTVIRPTAAAFLAVGALWGEPATLQVGAAALAFVIALAAHGTKAGFRVALNAGKRNGSAARISTAEDIAAVVLVFAALEFPGTALAAGALIIAILAFFGPRLWRAFVLGLRCMAAWFRTLFVNPGWHEATALKPRLRKLLDTPRLGAGQPRATRAAVDGLAGVGAYRNGWLVTTADGPAFLYGGTLTARRVDLPTPSGMAAETSLWAHTVQVQLPDGGYTLYLLKDGPPVEVILDEMQVVAR